MDEPEVPKKEWNVEQMIATYLQDGVLVIPNVLSPEEVTLCRKGLHDDLLSLGVDHNNLAGSLEALQSIQTHQSGGLPLHYSPWRIKYCACNENFFGFIQQLWKVTWAINAPGFECPYAPFPTDSGFALIDSVNFRLPSSLIQPVRSKDKLQKNLGPHVDLNPWDKWGGKKGKTRWRPFQGFISLTNQTGGFECVKGFHKQIDDLFSRIPRPENHNIGFYAFQQQHVFRKFLDAFESIPCNPGDALIWDWRIMHRTATTHTGTDTREVVYTSFLPNIPLNQSYARKQLEDFKRGLFPPDYKQKIPKSELGRTKEPQVPCWNFSVVESLTEGQKALLGFNLPELEKTQAASMHVKDGH